MELTLKRAIAAILLMLSFAAPVAAGPLEDAFAAYSRCMELAIRRDMPIA